MIKLDPKANWHKVNHPHGGDWYRWGDTTAHIALEQGMWHLSISTPHRYPTWGEIYTAWYDLCPDAAQINAAIILPRKSEYVNLHPNCFHVHQLRDAEMPAEVIL